MRPSRIIPVLMLLVSPLFMGQIWPSEKSAIAKGVQSYLDSHPECIFFQHSIPHSPHPANRDVQRELAALAHVGLVQITTPGTYDLTPTGGKYYIPTKGFCAGKSKLLQVDLYTTPVSFFGRKITTVTYTYEIIDLAEWANNPEIQKAFVYAERLLKPGPMQRSKENYVETSEGWINQNVLD